MTPELLLSCSTCPAIGSWIVPRPEMLEMVHEIAQRAGWRLEPCRCPECGRQAETAAPGPLARGKVLNWRALVAFVRDLRERGLRWQEVAHLVSGQVGFRVRERRVMNGYHKAVAARRSAAA